MGGDYNFEKRCSTPVLVLVKAGPFPLNGSGGRSTFNVQLSHNDGYVGKLQVLLVLRFFLANFG